MEKFSLNIMQYLNLPSYDDKMKEKILTITKEDLYEYFKTLRGESKIRRFWRNMISTMPTKLRKEFKTKKNDLVVVSEGVYKFKVTGGSKNLEEFIDQYSIVLKEESVTL